MSWDSPKARKTLLCHKKVLFLIQYVENIIEKSCFKFCRPSPSNVFCNISMLTRSLTKVLTNLQYQQEEISKNQLFPEKTLQKMNIYSIPNL